MFNALVCAKLNVLIGNDDSCIASYITQADEWMAAYPVGTMIFAGGIRSPWRIGQPLYNMLNAYNNGDWAAPSIATDDDDHFPKAM